MANIVQKDAYHWEVFFEGMPDWVIPMIKVVPQFYVDDDHDMLNGIVNKYLSFNYFWEKVDENNYRLYIYIDGYATAPEYEGVKVYADLSLWIINNNFRDSVQHTLGY